MRSFLSILLVLSLVLLTACSGNQPSDVNSSDPTATSDTSVSSSPSNAVNEGAFAPLKYAVSDLNLQGKKIVVATWNDFNVPSSTGTTIGDMKLARMQKAMEKYGFTFEYKMVPSDTYYTEMASALYANVFFADMVYAGVEASLGMVRNKVFKSLDEYIDYDNAELKPYANLVEHNGKHYGLVISKSTPYVVIYNPAMLRAVGAEDPLTLQKAGKWDWDAVKRIAKKCVRTDGSGKTTQYGISSTVIRYLIPLNGVVGIGTAANDKFKVDLFDDACVNALEFYRQLSAEGLLDKGENWYDWGTNVQNFVQGSTAMLFAPIWEAPLSVYANGFKEFSAVPAPMGPDVPAGQYIVPEPYGQMMAIPENTTVDVKDLLACYLAYNYNDPNDLETYIDEDENRVEDFSSTYKFRSVDEVTAYIDTQNGALAKNTYFGGGDAQGFGEVYKMFDTQVITPIYKGDSVKVTLEKVKPAILAKIKEIEKQ